MAINRAFPQTFWKVVNSKLVLTVRCYLWGSGSALCNTGHSPRPTSPRPWIEGKTDRAAKELVVDTITVLASLLGMVLLCRLLVP